MTQSRKFCVRQIRPLCNDRLQPCALVVSQRVTSVRWCDRIAVLEDGVVSAVGTHDELLGSSALYREVFEHQTLVGAPS